MERNTHWYCPECNADNHKDSDECFSCGFKRKFESRVWLWKVKLQDVEKYGDVESSWWFELPLDAMEESSIWEDKEVEITIVTFEPETTLK